MLSQPASILAPKRPALPSRLASSASGTFRSTVPASTSMAISSPSGAPGGQGGTRVANDLTHPAVRRTRSHSGPCDEGQTMSINTNTTMADALRLTQAGSLAEATALLQRALTGA